MLVRESTTFIQSVPSASAAKLRPRRFLVALVTSGLLGALFSLPSDFPLVIVIGRTVIDGMLALLAFSVAEQWPTRLPTQLPRWLWQLLSMLVITPPGAFFAYWLTTGGDPQFADVDRFQSAAVLAVFGTLIAMLVALAGIVIQREVLARAQESALKLAQSELARSDADARLRLLQAQTTPHFLFNTLANVQALVDSGSQDASALLSNLIGYLRAAVPHAGRHASHIEQEVAMASAYLEIMRIRIPDRLRYQLTVDPTLLSWPCPTMVLLSLIENAVRHGIDPRVEGGTIEVELSLLGENDKIPSGVSAAQRCLIRVRNPLGPAPLKLAFVTQIAAPTLPAAAQPSPGLGSGLETLRERLRLMFGDQAELRTLVSTDGFFTAEVVLPAS
jgi:Histidine kinase